MLTSKTIWQRCQHPTVNKSTDPSLFHVFSKQRAKELIDPKPLIEQAELAMEEMYECVLGVMKKW